MVKVIAQHVGFYGGRVRSIGDEFEVINEEWADEGRRPKWVKLAEVAAGASAAAEVKNRADKKKG